jgi:hypothetical protein
MVEMIDVIDADGNLDIRVLKARRFSANGINFDNEIGEGCVSDALNIAYLGTVALIRPSVFLSVTPPDFIRSTEYLMKLETAFGSPYLDVNIPPENDDVPAIRSHEGRSRMSAILKKWGDVPVPICLFFSMQGFTLRAREIERSWIEMASAGVIRERRGAPPEWVKGPIFDQVAYLENGRDPRLLNFRERSKPRIAMR